MADARMCSKCKEKPAVNGQTYCRECRNKYQQEYEAAQAEMLGAKWFQRGAEAMRIQLRDAFACQPVGMFAGMEIARYIHEAPSPQRAADQGSPANV